MKLSYFGPAILTLIVVSGCSSNSADKVATAQHFYYVDSDQQAAADKGEAFEDPSKLAPKNEGGTEDDLNKLTKEQVAAAAAFKKSPTNEQAKSDYIAKTVRLATASMASESLDRKVKYRQALKYYREALKVDPTNEEAKNNSEMIISIYKSMGRPVPN